MEDDDNLSISKIVLSEQMPIENSNFNDIIIPKENVLQSICTIWINNNFKGSGFLIKLKKKK